MNLHAKNKLLIGGLFLYASAFLINYLVRTTPSLHFAKDGGISNIVLFQCIGSYLFFLILHRGLITFLGLGFLLGFVSFVIDFFLLDFIYRNNSDYFHYVLIHQLITVTLVFFTGTCFLLISNKLQ